MADASDCREKRILNWCRLIFAVGYFAVGLGLAAYVYFRYPFLTSGVAPEPGDPLRFLWSLASALIGFAVLAFTFRFNSSSPWPKYVTYYLPILIFVSALATGSLSFADSLDGASYFYFAFGVCGLLGLLADSLVGLATKAMERLT